MIKKDENYWKKINENITKMKSGDDSGLENVSLLNGHSRFCHCESCWQEWFKSIEDYRKRRIILNRNNQNIMYYSTLEDQLRIPDSILNL